MRTAHWPSLATLFATVSLAGCLVTDTSNPPPPPAAVATQTTSTASSTVPPELTASTWRVDAIADREVAAGDPVILRFDSAGRVSGNTGCNSFNGSFSADATGLTFGLMATTRRAGPEALMNQEQRFLAALAAASTWKIEAGRLSLFDRDRKVLLRAMPETSHDGTSS